MNRARVLITALAVVLGLAVTAIAQEKPQEKPKETPAVNVTGAWDMSVEAPVETAPANAVLVVDGVFLLRRELVDLWDFSVFVAVPFAETQRRVAERDAVQFGGEEATLRRYAARYVPGQQIYFAEANPQDKANVVVDNEDPDRPRLRSRGPLLTWSAPKRGHAPADGPHLP